MPRMRHVLPLPIITALCAVPAADAAVQARSATLERGDLREYDQTNTSTGSLALDASQAYDGHRSLRATFNGGANGYERGLFNVDWKDGDDVWYGGAFYLPAGFKSRMQGQVDIMRWDNWGHFGDWDDRSGVVIHRNGMGNLMRMKFGVENVDIGPAFQIPEGRWFWLEVHQKLSRYDGQAFSEVFIDGQRVSTTTTANTYGRGVDRIRYGIVAIDQARQKTPLTLWFDRTTISTSQVGPLGGAPGVSAAPAAGSTPQQATAGGAPATGGAGAGSTGGAVEPNASAAAAAGGTVAAPAGVARLVDLARHGATTASSRRRAAFRSHAAVDGSARTRWMSRPRRKQWWSVDLRGLHEVHQVRVTWGRAYAKRYAVQLSQDGRHWWNAARVRAHHRGTVRTALHPAQVRFVRIRALRRAHQVGVAITRAQVLGTP